MKFYVASSFKNINSVRYVANTLKGEGFTHTYDWTQNDRAEDIPALREIGEKEKIAVMESDFVIVLLPGGKGSHIELGIALGLGKRVYLYSPDQQINDPTTTSTFYHLPEVYRFAGSLGGAQEELPLGGSRSLDAFIQEVKDRELKTRRTNSESF
jgi:hypothetical protein